MLEPWAATTTANVKHCSTSSQMGIDSHTKGPPCRFSINNYKMQQRAKQTSLRRQSKHQEQTQMWYQYWNDQGISNNWLMCKSRQYSRRGERCKPRNGNSVTEMKNAFDDHIIRLHIAKEGISEFEDLSLGISQTEIWLWNMKYTHNWNTRRRRERDRWNIWIKNGWNISKNNERHHTIDTGNSGNTKQDKKKKVLKK